MTGILIVIAFVIVGCTIVNFRRGVLPRLGLTLSLILAATLIVGLLGPLMRHHPVASLFVSMTASVALYFYFKVRATRV